ncbi:TPA: hypothetical protein QDB01_000323 [Burkholderia vietnamiensis]|nr:hypothetical protein [Burkholderia vietnamiensis]
MNERIFDLDDVHALCRAFTHDELAWVTLPAAWKHDAPLDQVDDTGFASMPFFDQSRSLWNYKDRRVGPQTYTNHVLHRMLNPGKQDGCCTVSSDDLRALDHRFAAFVEERTGRRPADPTFLFTPLEASWIHGSGAFERLDDPEWRAIVVNNRGQDGEVEGPGGAVVEMDDHGGTSELYAIRLIEQPTVAFDSTDIDHDAIEILGRVLDVQAQALREVAEQAMAEQGDKQPVRTARARL